MGSGGWSLPSSDAAPDKFELQPGILGGFYRAAHGFADERGDLNSALLDLQDHRSGHWAWRPREWVGRDGGFRARIFAERSGGN
jgi:hypothetical protein